MISQEPLTQFFGVIYTQFFNKNIMCYICFTNRDIMVNLYKLNKKFVLHLFSMLPFFLSTKQKIFHPFTFPPSQPNKMRENKISSIHSLFHPLFIFYLSHFPSYRANASLSFKRMLLKRMKDDYSMFFRIFFFFF